MDAFLSPQILFVFRPNGVETGLRKARIVLIVPKIIGIRLRSPVNTLSLGSRYKPFAPIRL
jgi:hypothetical protein